ncbi:Hint domain-containing protein [Neokomagataea thailandica]|uniref:Outer membrane protein n=1 Tax=Neokomagataea tanensis NBRC 106556 TaxID=1223519 RepID=A0ABQ0QGM4_9PROT|nr:MULTISPECIES: Hint domain-containing protein [Neokomagataea]GBR44011.1 outer membrane protein [Neokomagataea tanensis NBRC 106556]
MYSGSFFTNSGSSYNVIENDDWFGDDFTVQVVNSFGHVLYNGVPDGIVFDDQSIDDIGGPGTVYVSLPNSTGSINLLSGGETFYIGGNTIINLGILADLDTNIYVVGGNVKYNDVADIGNHLHVTLSDGGSFQVDTEVFSVDSKSSIRFGEGGGTLVINSKQSVIDLSHTSILNYDPGNSTIELQNTIQPVTSYSIKNLKHDTVRVTLYSGNNVLGVYEAQLAKGVSLQSGSYDTLNGVNNPLNIFYDDGNTYLRKCFLAGASIETGSGFKLVEDIVIGDVVMAYDPEGRHAVGRAVQWVGQRQASVEVGLFDDEAGYPVRIAKNAIAPGVPRDDLLVTSEHCMLLDGVFVPVRMLVNGRTISYDRSIMSYQYYHIETENHTIIRANGALTESYLNTGNRHSFEQCGHVVSIGGSPAKTWEHDAAAPLACAMERVEPLFRMLEVRADELGFAPVESLSLTHDAGLMLRTDTGTTLDVLRRVEGSVFFRLPAGTAFVELLSRVSRPCDYVGPFCDDRRRLGVGVAAITLHGLDGKQDLTGYRTDVEVLGWHACEHSEVRWTSGAGRIDLPATMQEGIWALEVQIVASGPYIVADMYRAQKAVGL